MKHLIFVMTVLAVITLSAPALHSAGGMPDQSNSAKDARRLARITAARTINVAEIKEQMAKGEV